ncbi:hypothetical protein ACFH04_08120 [Streptomyces noboritoensis]|uniref:Uncharacterized protein n=1 Tax=Streptomyces noboritoensis TaxID=67337 RepID=A0ABV6TD28_9ACTN
MGVAVQDVQDGHSQVHGDGLVLVEAAAGDVAAAVAGQHDAHQVGVGEMRAEVPDLQPGLD